MEKMIIVFNSIGNTVDVWFDDPKKETICEETGAEIILKKDRNGRIIGFEKLNFLTTKGAAIPMELIVK